MIKEVTKKTFEKQVLQAKKVVLVDFWSPSCVQCKALEPQIEKLAEENSKKLKTVKMNMIANLIYCKRFGIMSLPTIIFYKDGGEIKRLTGKVNIKAVKNAIKEILEGTNESDS